MTVELVAVGRDAARVLEGGTLGPVQHVTKVAIMGIGPNLDVRRSLRACLFHATKDEFTSVDFMKWAAQHRIDVQQIEPGKPMQNAFCESSNGSFRDESLNTTWFSSPPEARRRIEAWRPEYNTERPHSSLGNPTPHQYEQTWRAAT